MSNSNIYIVGPCAAESREQVVETARAISNLRFDIGDFRLIFRAGVWKPRTNPHTFQGAGAQALEWLAEVKRTYGMEIATEVVTPEHVATALEAGVDYLWIGARSSANPLAVQAIADSVNAAKPQFNAPKALCIKNPVNADAELWLGNIERLEKTGVPVMAVHRGCNHQPCWAMAHKVRMARPDIPMLLDPSHMSGDAAQVPALMGKVAELGLDGTMIEVHIHPETALSDAKQQITPEVLSEIIPFGVPAPCLRLSRTQTAREASERVLSPQEGKSAQKESTELNWLRAEIDELDERLWDTLTARMDVSARIGEWKKAHGVAPLQPERVKVISEKLKVKSEKLGMDEAWMLRVWDLIHEQSLKQQE